MIKLFGFGKNLGLPDGSPFVIKLHTFLRVAGIEYELVSGAQNIRKSPKGKLPFIVDGENTLGDSQFIMEYLSRKYDIDLDKHLSEEQKAISYLISKSLDENLYWCLVWSRWQHEETWQKVKGPYFKGLPFPLSLIVPNIIRKKTIKSLFAQGTGRHSDAEIISIADKTFQSLSTFLADKDYFFGDTISSFDITAYAFLSSVILTTIDNDMYNKARSYSNLVNYCERINQKYFNK